MKGASVLFKGIRDGLEVHIKEDSDIQQVKTDILKKLTDGRQFFGETTINLVFSGKTLTPLQQTEIVETIGEQINVGNVKFIECSEDAKKGSAPAEENLDAKEIDLKIFTGIEEGMTRFVRGTIRNGQRVFYEGNVVVIGDVNPGGEVIAGGNIVIFGTLRGLAHAGVTGNREATIACFRFQPTQLRIATLINRPPEDEDNIQPIYPEIAYIKDDILVIEPVK